MASKRHLRNKSCTGKIQFDSTDDAYAFMKKKGPFGILHVYKCKFCHKYHIGHMMSKNFREMNKQRGPHG